MITQCLIRVRRLMGSARFARSKPYVTPAKSGEMVLVVVATSKPEKKAPYESWMRDVMKATVYKSQHPVKRSS